MFKKPLMTTLAIAGLIGTVAWAQKPDLAVVPGDERPRRDHRQVDRLAGMVEYLELSEAQAAEWQATMEQHSETVRQHRQSIETRRDEFRALAEQQDPNLEQLGRIALDIHRQTDSARSSRGQLLGDLEEILTPEQAERFEALKAAREFSHHRGRRGSRGGWSPRDPD